VQALRRGRRRHDQSATAGRRRVRRARRSPGLRHRGARLRGIRRHSARGGCM